MNLQQIKFGYDPDNYDDEPSDYVNSETTYDADDLSRDTAEEFEEDDEDLTTEAGDEDLIGEDDEDLIGEEGDDEFVEVDDDDDLDELDNEVLDDDTEVDEDDPINDDVTDYPSSDDPEAFSEGGRKQVYIKDMPYIDAR